MTDTIEARWEAHNEAGRRYFGLGDYANAEQAFVAAIREATALGDNNVRLASSLSNFGQLKYKQKDLIQAEALFRRALAIRESVLGPDHFGLVQNLNNLAALHYARGELELAEPLFRRALQISEQALGEAHPDVGITLNNLARLYFRRNDFKAAAPLLLRLLQIKQDALGASHPEVAAILTSLARVRFAEGDYDAAEQLGRRALGIREQIHVPNDPAIATSLETLAEICGARGKREEELDLRARALSIREGSMGADDPTVVAARASLETRRASGETRAPVVTPQEFRTLTVPAYVPPAHAAPTAPPPAPVIPPIEQDAPLEISQPIAAERIVDAEVSDIKLEIKATSTPGLDIAPLIEMPGLKPASAAPVAGTPAPPPVAGTRGASPPLPAKPAAPSAGNRISTTTSAPRRSSGGQSPPTTTKTRSLPWIEPPTSELVLSRTQQTQPRPAAPRPAAPIVPPAVHPTAHAPPAASAPPAAPPAERAPAPIAAAPAAPAAPLEPARSRTPDRAPPPVTREEAMKAKTPAESYANLLAHGTSDSIERGSIDVVTGVQPAIRREVSLEDYKIPEQRSWLGYLAAAVIIGALAAGGWFFWGRQALASRGSRDLNPATSAGTVAGNPDKTAGARDSIAAPITKAPPPPEPRPTGPAPKPPAAAPVEEDPAPPPRKSPTLALPAVNTDRLTQAIADSAKANVDSVTKGLGVNPPTFKSGSPPSPPSSPHR